MMMKKNGRGSYPVGDTRYGTMGPRTFDEYQSLNFRNRDIDNIKRKVGTPGVFGTTFVTKKPKTKA
jgi:hypothetical protein